MASGSMENMDIHEQQPTLMAPPDNYAFNNLIQDFAEEIKEDDVKVIKRRFEGIIPRDVQTGCQIVDHLRQNGYISETNIIYLQQVIRILGRPKLLMKTIEFAKCNEKIPILHFRKTTFMKMPGFKVIKIHVEGQGRLNHKKLDELRHEISKIVLVPPEDVSFAGVEETNSFVITLILPDMYCKALQVLLLNTKKHYHFVSLRKFGVDRIKVLGKWYEISENDAPLQHFNESEASTTERNWIKPLPKMESANIERENNVEEDPDTVSVSKGFKNKMSAGAKKRQNKDAVLCKEKVKRTRGRDNHRIDREQDRIQWDTS